MMQVNRAAMRISCMENRAILHIVKVLAISQILRDLCWFAMLFSSFARDGANRSISVSPFPALMGACR